ncbi:MAG: glycosyltransferase [Spirosomataceae bacterium]
MKSFPIRTLIYDRDISGHHLDYLQFLVEYLKNMPLEIRNQFVFVLNEEAKSRFSKDDSQIEFHYIQPAYLSAILAHTNVLRRASAEMHYLTTLIHEYEARRVIFMHIDAFQYELGRAVIRDLGVKFAGLMFLPFRREYEGGKTLQSKLKRDLRGLRKGLQVRWMLRNKNLERIFFLNDKKGVEVYNQRYENRFDYLPDPIEIGAFPNESAESLKKKYGVEVGKTIFLIYGHLSSRKNIPNILAALKNVDPIKWQEMTFLICGEPEKSYEKILFSTIEETEKKYPAIHFVKHFNFFGPAETNEIFKISDIVLVPYINFFSSSNILGLAAKYNKPLIAANLGVMEGLVTQYQLGETVSPHRPDEIALAINRFLNQPHLLIDGAKYLEDHAAEVFCQKILF